MTEALAFLGYVAGAAAAIAALIGLSYGALLVVCRFIEAIERDDDVARAASGMDEFSAPEGGERRD